jgi:hypothetical protein
MALLAEIPYKDIDFVWVSGHYDHHLTGLCRYQGKLCRFSVVDSENTEYDEKLDLGEEDYVEERWILTGYIYSLTLKEKIKWLYTKKKFEWCVGYHWTYPYRSDWNHRRRHFYIRRPTWLYRALFNFHYHGFNFKKWRNKKFIS